jgi:hypothetical protein
MDWSSNIPARVWVPSLCALFGLAVLIASNHHSAPAAPLADDGQAICDVAIARWGRSQYPLVCDVEMTSATTANAIVMHDPKFDPPADTTLMPMAYKFAASGAREHWHMEKVAGVWNATAY